MKKVVTRSFTADGGTWRGGDWGGGSAEKRLWVGGQRGWVNVALNGNCSGWKQLLLSTPTDGRTDGQIEEKCQKSKKSFRSFPQTDVGGPSPGGGFHKPSPDRPEESIFWLRVNKGILSADWPGSREGIIYHLLVVLFSFFVCLFGVFCLFRFVFLYGHGGFPFGRMVSAYDLDLSLNPSRSVVLCSSNEPCEK